MRLTVTHVRLALSIPLWCDWDVGLRWPGGGGGHFQSHCGAIGTTTAGGQPVSLLYLSIPLWCDWDNSMTTSWPSSRMTFNPTVVRLGRSLCSPDYCSHCAFNPTVVRLGRLSGPRRRTLPPAFQSHCGAIGTWPGVGEGLAAALLFQSHCGAIGTVLLLVGQRQLAPLSIPLWCDWDFACLMRRFPTKRPFNPTVVRLGRG